MVYSHYFLAGRYRNKANVLDLARRIRKKGKTVYCFVESPASLKHVGAIGDDAEVAISWLEALPDWRNHPAIREVFEADMTAQRQATNFILLLPAGKFAHIEAGAAYGMGKRCIVIGEQKEAETLYLIFDEHYATVEEFLKSV
jgi:hypothetical protein